MPATIFCLAINEGTVLERQNGAVSIGGVRKTRQVASKHIHTQSFGVYLAIEVQLLVYLIINKMGAG